MKVDDEQQVSELFQSSIRFDSQPVDISVKKFVFKLISEVSGTSGSGRVPINSIWQKYFQLSDDQQKNVATSKPHLNSKEDLMRTLNQMEADDLAMLDGDDVILTGQ